MKEQILDISFILNAINGKVDSLSKQLNTALEEIVVLKKEIVVLKDRLAVYETPKDSHNSSIQPSKESIKSNAAKSQKLLATRSLREKSNKPSGGQIGHKGSTLEFSKEPGFIVQHSPSFCSRCEVDFPTSVRSNNSYGPNIRALVTYFSCTQYVLYKRMTEVLLDCFGINMSQGAVDNILQDMSLKSLTAYDEIHNRIEQAEVAGGDETGENINGALYWIWAWVTPDLTYIFSDKSRGKVAIDKHFKNGLPHTVLVTDRHASYMFSSHSKRINFFD